MDLFDMANITVPEAKKEEKANSKPKSEPKQKKAEVVRYGLPLTIFYCGFEQCISKEEYPEKDTLTEDELLNHMQSNFGYRILTKNRCSFEYDKEASELIVYLKNPSKGSLDASSYSNGIHFINQGDALGFFKKDQYGEQFLFADGSSKLNFEKKVPFSFLMDIYEKFVEHFPNEYLAQIFYDRENKEYLLDFPEQETTESSVYRRRGSFFLKENRNIILVAEFHSHGRFRAQFSNVDDENELDFLLYGVMGELHQSLSYVFEHTKVRLGFNGFFSMVPLEKIFDESK